MTTRTKKVLLRTSKILLVTYVLICALLYFFQEKLIFQPEKLPHDFEYNFRQPFVEHNFPLKDGSLLNGLLFKSDSSRGLIFYLHGNAGSIRSWGDVATSYTSLQYDVFILDYPGYGKSSGSIKSEKQLFEVIQLAYDTMKLSYPETSIVVLGYSIGTGLAAKLSSDNHPKMLILQAPYYSLRDLMNKNYPLVPRFLLRYPLQTYHYLVNCKMPVTLFHGDRDEVIYYESSLKLKSLLKPKDTLITLPGFGHNGMTNNQNYLTSIKYLLNSLE